MISNCPLRLFVGTIIAIITALCLFIKFIGWPFLTCFWPTCLTMFSHTIISAYHFLPTRLRHRPCVRPLLQHLPASRHFFPTRSHTGDQRIPVSWHFPGFLFPAVPKASDSSGSVAHDAAGVGPNVGQRPVNSWRSTASPVPDVSLTSFRYGLFVVLLVLLASFRTFNPTEA